MFQSRRIDCLVVLIDCSNLRRFWFIIHKNIKLAALRMLKNGCIDFEPQSELVTNNCSTDCRVVFAYNQLS